MKIYKKIIPESIRVQIRNPQYILHDIKFFFRFIIHKFLQNIIPKIDTNIPLKNKKSICYIIPTTNISGGVAVVCEHLNRLQKLGYKCLIASYDNKTDLSWFPNQSVKVIPLRGNKDIVENYNTVVATGWITAYELLLLNVKRKTYLVQSDETRFYPKGSYLKNRVKRTYCFPFNFLTIAKWLQIWLKENFNKDSVYIPNGINTDIFYPDAPLEPKPKNKKRILLEGAINLPFKGMKEAFSVVQNLNCEVWCVSYDGKPERHWHCDRFFEKVPMNMMRRIYSSCDILLKLSRVEGFFGPPLEMMACGGVSIVTNVTGYDEYIINGYNALVTKSVNSQKVRKLIEKLINNQKMYDIINSNSQKTIKKMNWQNTIIKLVKVLNYE